MPQNVAVNAVQLKKSLNRCMDIQRVGFVKASPGTGKSAIIAEIAKERNLKLIDVRLSQCDPTDLNGFPMIDTESNKSRYAANEIFPTQEDVIPEGYSGWLLLLDELNHADRSVQKAAYKLLLDRMVGMFHLHSQVYVLAAGNLDTDNALTEEMGTAMQSRVVHYQMNLEKDPWCAWALKAGVDFRVISFIHYRQDLLHSFNPNHNDETFACPRTWHMVSDFIKGQTDITFGDDLADITGAISEGPAREFITFCQIYKKLLTVDQIIANPHGVPMPSEGSILYALTGTISSNATETNVGDLIVFINRMPMEFQVICLRELLARNKELISIKEVNDWIVEKSPFLFGKG